LMSVADVDCGFCLPITPVHLSNYESFDQLVFTKSAIYHELPHQAMAVIDLDQPQAAHWRHQLQANPTLIGDQGDIHVRLNNHFEVLMGEEIMARVSMENLPHHFFVNMKMVAGALLALQLPLKMIEILENYRGLPGRLYHYTLEEIDLYDDSYNASLESVKAGIDVLSVSKRKRVLVFGDMGEIGAQSKQYHKEVGQYANGRIDLLISVGQEAYSAYEAFSGPKKHIAAALEFDAQWVTAGCAVLVKGSRFMKMEQVVKRLLIEFGGEYVS
jgi:UDP-N-acetylmuramoyl-tripeptide--D-alanyl-D-alanine ligase